MIDLSGIRAVAFDAVGTLMRPVPRVAATYRAIGRRYGSRLTLEQVDARFREWFARVEREDFGPAEDFDDPGHFTTSEPRERARWERIVGAVLDDVSDPATCFEEVFEAFGRPEAWRCFDDVGPTVAALHGRGLRTAIASNFDGRLRSIVAGMDALRDVEACVISSEVGYRKPARGFYRALCEAVSCAPAEVLMVGDDYENDVVGARHSGLPAVHLVRDGDPSSVPAIRSLTELIGEG